MTLLTNRRDSYFQGERRRSTVRFERRMSQLGQDPVRKEQSPMFGSIAQTFDFFQGAKNSGLGSEDSFSGSGYSSFDSHNFEAVDDFGNGNATNSF